jgi:hypothetical protein
MGAFRRLLWSHSCIVCFFSGNLSNGAYLPSIESSELCIPGTLLSRDTLVAVEARTVQQVESRPGERSNESAGVRMCGKMGHFHRIEPRDEDIRLMDGGKDKAHSVW